MGKVVGNPLFDEMSVRVGADVFVGISVNASCCSGELLKLHPARTADIRNNSTYTNRILAKRAITLLPFLDLAKTYHG